MFLKEYLATAFDKSWSNEHEVAIARLEQAILHGGLFAIAMPRGSGKTTISEGAALWALLYGYRRYVLLIAAVAKKGEGLLKEIRSWLRFSDELLEDFPEVCAPIVALEGISHRSQGQ